MFILLLVIRSVILLLTTGIADEKDGQILPEYSTILLQLMYFVNYVYLKVCL